MKLYLARVTDEEGGNHVVQVFKTAKERKRYIDAVLDQDGYFGIDKHTCEFPATKEGIVAFFNRHAWHEQ